MESYIYKVYLVLSTYFIFMRNNNYSQVWVIGHSSWQSS